MRSRAITVRLPFPLYEALQHVCHERHFAHMHGCIIGACITIVQDERRRAWVKEISNAKPKDQDFLLAKMLSFPTEKEAMKRELKKLDRK